MLAPKRGIPPLETKLILTTVFMRGEKMSPDMVKYGETFHFLVVFVFHSRDIGYLHLTKRDDPALCRRRPTTVLHTTQDRTPRVPVSFIYRSLTM